MSASAKTLGLTGVLMALIIRAERKGDGNLQSASLKGGLMIEVSVRAQAFTLRISRGGTRPPGLIEWRTCVARLPEAYRPIEKIEPKAEAAEDGRNYLTATWPLGQRKLL